MAGERIHALVADDEPHIGRIIKMKLEQGPFRVTLAYDGREALEILRQEPDIGIVLLDLMMPHSVGTRRPGRAPGGPQAEGLAVHHSHGRRAGAATPAGDATGRDRVPDQAIQPQEAVRADGGARGRRARGGRMSETESSSFQPTPSSGANATHRRTAEP